MKTKPQPRLTCEDVEADAEILWIGAFRYYLGRMTYAVGDFCSTLCRKWCVLPHSVKVLIARELDEAFERDDEQRAKPVAVAGAHSYALGMDCDRKEWEKVRALTQPYNAALTGRWPEEST